jgi:hypothetical protein
MSPTRKKGVLRLFDSVHEFVLRDEEEAKEVLREAGLDPGRVAVEGGAAARRIGGMARLQAAAEGRKQTEGHLEVLRARIAERLRSAGTDVKEALARLLADQSQLAPQVHFRKVENLSDEDAINMLTEAELLRLWEELEDSDGASGRDG